MLKEDTEVGYEYYHEISNLRGTNMNKNLYSIKLNITQDKHSLKRKNLIYEIESIIKLHIIQ